MDFQGKKVLITGASRGIGRGIVEDLLAVDLDDFESLAHPRLDGVQAYRTTKALHGREWTVVVTRSEALLELVDTDVVRVDVPVPQNRYAEVVAGTPATVTWMMRQPSGTWR